MELVISLALIIAINELKEFRLNKKYASILSEMQYFKNYVSVLHKSLIDMDSRIERMGTNLSAIQADIHAINLSHGSIQEKLEDIKIKSDAVLKEFELNGAPIKMRPPGVDIIEGF